MPDDRTPYTLEGIRRIYFSDDWRPTARIIRSWITDGVSGIKLEAIRLGGSQRTHLKVTPASLDLFFQRISAVTPAISSQKKRRKRSGGPNLTPVERDRIAQEQIDRLATRYGAHERSKQ